MKTSAKSSVTLPAEELRMVEDLQARLGIKTRIEVVRRGLRLLKETTDRASLRAAYEKASAATRGGLTTELDDLDHLVAEGLDEK